MDKGMARLAIISLTALLIFLCVGIYYLATTGKVDNKKEAPKVEEVVIQKKVYNYKTKNELKIFDNYVVELGNDSVKVTDLNMNLISEKSFENSKYLNVYYGVDNSVYVINSNDFDSEDLSELHNFTIYKLEEKDFKEIKNTKCGYVSFMYKDDKHVIGIQLDDNEIINYMGTYIHLQGYSISNYGTTSYDADKFIYSNKAILYKEYESGREYAFVNLDNDEFKSTNYSSITAITNGDFRVKQNGKYGILSDNSLKIEMVYDFIDVNSDKMFVAYDGNKITVYDYGYVIVNNDPIDFGDKKIDYYETETLSNTNSIHGDFVVDKYLLEYNDNSESNSDDFKLYIISGTGNVVIKDDVKSYYYDKLLKKIFIYDWDASLEEKVKTVKEYWNLDLSVSEEDSIKFYLNDISVIVNYDYSATLFNKSEKIAEFYATEFSIGDNYILYKDNLREENTYVYYK